MSHFSRLPRESLHTIFSYICKGYCDQVINSEATLAVFDLFYKHASALERCAKMKLRMWDSLCRVALIPGPPGFQQEWLFDDRDELPSYRAKALGPSRFDLFVWRRRLTWLACKATTKQSPLDIDEGEPDAVPPPPPPFRRRIPPALRHLYHNQSEVFA